jgi:hypothetical protein
MTATDLQALHNALFCSRAYNVFQTPAVKSEQREQ